MSSPIETFVEGTKEFAKSDDKEYIWQIQVLEMTKDEPLGGIFAETPIKPGYEKEENTDN